MPGSRPGMTIEGSAAFSQLPRHDEGRNRMRMARILLRRLGTVLVGIFCWVGAAEAQSPSLVQPWGLPPLPAGIGPVEKFADVSGTPQGQFLEGGSFDTQGNLWFV